MVISPKATRVLRKVRIGLSIWLIVSFLLTALRATDFLGYFEHYERASHYLQARLGGDMLYLSFNARKVSGGNPGSLSESDARPAWAVVQLHSLTWDDDPQTSEILKGLPWPLKDTEYSNDLTAFDVAAKQSVLIPIVTVDGYELQCTDSLGPGSCSGSKEQIDAFIAVVTKTAHDCAPCIVPYTPYGHVVLAEKSTKGVLRLTIIPAPYGKYHSWAWYLAMALLLPGVLIVGALFAIGYHSH